MGARMHAENAIRKKNEIPFIIKLASNIDSVASHIQTAISTHKTMNDISSLVANLDKAVQVMDSEKIATIMSKFGEQCSDLKQQSAIMDSSMYLTSASTVPSEEVDAFLRDIAVEREICLGSELDSIQMATNGATSTQKTSESLQKSKKEALRKDWLNFEAEINLIFMRFHFGKNLRNAHCAP